MRQRWWGWGRAGLFSVSLLGMTATVLSAPHNIGWVKQKTKKVWVQIDPIQCRGNPWEQGWQPIGDESGTVAQRLITLLDRTAELKHVREYYNSGGITIFDARFEAPEQSVATCQGCACPRGDTLYLHVGEQDVQRMVERGYRISE